MGVRLQCPCWYTQNSPHSTHRIVQTQSGTSVSKQFSQVLPTDDDGQRLSCRSAVWGRV